jgi:Terpene cyclase DEP1
MINAVVPPVRALLLVLATVGLAAPWWFNLHYLSSGGSLAPRAFFSAAFANALTTAITLDVYIAAMAFCLGVARDAEAGSRRWWAVPLTFGVGLSFALPLYLWWRSAPARQA